nr:protein dpy-30 homolog isoform X2 [Vicugna pacos]
MRAPDRGLSHPAPVLLRVLPRPGLVSGNCDLQGLPWSQSRCWKDRRRLQKIPTLSMVSQTTSRLLCIRENFIVMNQIVSNYGQLVLFAVLILRGTN